MRNFLPVTPWLVFDLKGATANRRALSARLLHEIDARAPVGGSSYGTLRDWEWLDIAMVVDVSESDKAEIAEVLVADAHFLRSQGLLDYSLLVGIHRLPEGRPGDREARLATLKANGGFVSVDRSKVYFFGIIDVLERFSLRWRAQRALLTAGYHCLLRGRDADGISALPPAEYAARFYTFVVREVLQLHRPMHRSERSSRSWLWATPRASWWSGSPRPGGTIENAERWGQLWQRRRRGLVKERIELDRADHMRRIDELEQQLAAQAHPARAAETP